MDLICQKWYFVTVKIKKKKKKTAYIDRILYGEFVECVAWFDGFFDENDLGRIAACSAVPWNANQFILKLLGNLFNTNIWWIYGSEYANLREKNNLTL